MKILLLQYIPRIRNNTSLFLNVFPAIHNAGKCKVKCVALFSVGMHDLQKYVS